jgi:predicted transcriptional regulator
MGNTISIRLPKDLADWLEDTARKTGLPKGKVIRQQLEKARAAEAQPFLRLAGSFSGPRNLSARKGFSLK